MNYFVE